MRAISTHDERGGAVLDALVLGVLAVDGVLLAAFGMMFNPLYSGQVPVPMGALFTILIMPWLVGRAAEIDPRRWVSATPLLAWAVTIGGVGLTGPGGDVLLPATWQSLLLCVAGLGSGLYALRRADSERADSGYGGA